MFIQYYMHKDSLKCLHLSLPINNNFFHLQHFADQGYVDPDDTSATGASSPPKDEEFTSGLLTYFMN